MPILSPRKTDVQRASMQDLRHSGESRNPIHGSTICGVGEWIPAFAGRTIHLPIEVAIR